MLGHCKHDKIHCEKCESEREYNTCEAQIKQLGRQEFCPKCGKLVYTIRGKVPRCPKCKSETQPVC